MNTHKVGDYFTHFINQADRDCETLAVLGDDTLFKYSMPAGRVFVGVFEARGYRPMALRTMPKRWQKAIAEQEGELTIDDALANCTVTDREYALAHKVPQWVKNLPCNITKNQPTPNATN